MLFQLLILLSPAKVYLPMNVSGDQLQFKEREAQARSNERSLGEVSGIIRKKLRIAGLKVHA